MKRWCCRLTYLAARAVHIEVVPSPKAYANLAALTRLKKGNSKSFQIIMELGLWAQQEKLPEAWNQSDIEQSLAQKQIN